MGYGTNSGYGGGYNTNPGMGNTSLQNTFPTQQYQGGGTTNYMTMPYQYGQNSPMGSTPPPGYTPQPQMPYGPLSMMGGMPGSGQATYPNSMPGGFNPGSFGGGGPGSSNPGSAFGPQGALPPGLQPFPFSPMPGNGSQRSNPGAAPAGAGIGSFGGGVSSMSGSGSLPTLTGGTAVPLSYPGQNTNPSNAAPMPGFVSPSQTPQNTMGLTPMQIAMGTHIVNGRLTF